MIKFTEDWPREKSAASKWRKTMRFATNMAKAVSYTAVFGSIAGLPGLISVAGGFRGSRLTSYRPAGIDDPIDVFLFVNRLAYTEAVASWGLPLVAAVAVLLIDRIVSQGPAAD
jgi:hypothetical protein